MRRGLVAVLAAAALLLAGCSEIPTSGPVQPGTTEAPNGTGIFYRPNGPAQGAKPQEIVAGFLTAASGGGSFSVAKQYLTTGFAKKWRPTTRVLVQSSRAALTGSGADIRADVPISASVDPEGAYTNPSSDSETLPFHLVQENGQWRIDSAENGIVLTETVFQQTYAPRLLQFFDPSWRRLVPDRRWFPLSGSDGGSAQDSERVVEALIRGPVGPLAGGVTANALRGTKLAGISPSTGGVTTVTLGVDGPMPDATTTRRMQQQLGKTLGLPTPAALRLVVNSLVVPQAPAIGDQLGTEAYVLAGGRFGTLSSSGAFTEERTLGPRIAATRPRAITVSLPQKTAAVLTNRGVDLVTASGAKPVDPRPDLVAPTLDQQGWVYSVPSTGTSELQVSNGKRTYRLGADLGSGTVTAIQVSPDGSRLLVLLEEPTKPVAYVAGIERNPDGSPKGLTAAQYPIDLSHTNGTGIDATWMGDGDVAVLVSGQDSDQVATQQLGGVEVTLAPFANVAALVGTSSVDDLRIRVGGGGLYVWDGDDTNWQQVQTAADISVLAVQR